LFQEEGGWQLHAHGYSLQPRLAANPYHEIRGIWSSLSDGDEDGTTGASVTWVHKEDESNSWSYLLDAFEAMANKRWRSVILPVYSAFEVSLTPLVSEGLEKYFPLDAPRDFDKKDSFTSYSALNVLLPRLCKKAKLKQLQSKIQKKIDGLRRLRNLIAHRGVANADISQETAGESLCAAIFGREYLRYLRPLLLGS
jgi:hypothetical protein